jgi:hypothetical protein
MRQAVRDVFFDFTAPLEGVVPWMYLDVKGLVTVGVGCLLDPISPPYPPFELHGYKATPADIWEGWKAVKFRQDLARVGHRAFESVCPLRLTDEGVRQLFDERLAALEGHLRNRFKSEWDRLPADAQLACLSMGWAMGGGFPHMFPRWSKALRAFDFETCALECEISTHGNPGVIPRNECNLRLFESAARVLKEGLDEEVVYGWSKEA